ncbi:MAG: VWA domain-containing protein [Candidatus Korobacteraceae bacterium]
MKRFLQKRDRKNERGQILILLACVMVGLLLCSALAVDIGFAYVTKARLVKAVDAACLSGMSSLAQGQTTAQTIATNSFTANYAVSGLDYSAPSVNVGFSTSAGQEVVNVTGTATIRTIFMALLPGYRTLTVNASAQALRGNLAMTIVLDRSGSMSSNGGGSALQSAVPTFIDYFNNTTDEVAMVSFASNATTDFAIASQFQSSITSKVGALNFSGGTFGPGGLTLAKAQEDSVTPQQGENLVKAVVYFTDGLVNEIQDTFNCTSQWGHTLYDYGGYDPPATNVDFFNPSDGTDWGGLDRNGNPPHSPTPDCTGVTKFTSQINGQQESFTRTNVTADAQYRALQTANALRAEGVYVYSIGLGSDPSQTFLQEIANDPASPTYNSSQPQGIAVFAPDCPSSTCTQELQQVFQTIASKILLRLTQ